MVLFSRYVHRYTHYLSTSPTDAVIARSISFSDDIGVSPTIVCASIPAADANETAFWCELFYLAMNNSARISISSTYSIIYRKRKCFCKSERSIFTYKPAKRMCIITVNRAMSTSDCSDMIRFSYLWNKINKLRLSPVSSVLFLKQTLHLFVHHNDISKSQHFFIMRFCLFISVFPKVMDDNYNQKRRFLRFL